MDEIVEKLKELGLNEYQSKVYVALLKKYPATGYEISKLANIPQSRAYDTLKVLENLHIAIPSNSKPVTYTPIKPKELTKRFKRIIYSSNDYVENSLTDVKEDYTEPILTIRSRTKIIDKVIEIIKSAKKTLYLSVWGQDFKFIEQHIMDAYNRGIEIKIVQYDDFVCNVGTVFKHSGVKMLEHYSSGRFIFLSIDNSEGLFGRVEAHKHSEPEIIWTKNPEIVFLIKAFSVHEMYLIDIEEHFPEQLRYFYGAGFKKLRDKVLRN